MHTWMFVAALSAPLGAAPLGAAPKAADAPAAPKPPRAARSVHLGYPGEGDAFVVDMIVRRSSPGSYFMAAGFSRGYFGLQELADGRRIAIFSVWDPTKGDDPKAVPPEKRVEVLAHAEDARISRFGGEGTGARCLMPFDWQFDRPYRFLVTASSGETTTTFSAYLFQTEHNRWKRLATYRTATRSSGLRGLYSFVEDFRRDGRSVGEVRRADFADAWVRGTDGKWTALDTARFAASNAAWESRDNVDAGVADGRFHLQTGGDTKTVHPVGSRLTRPARDSRPPELPKE